MHYFSVILADQLDRSYLKSFGMLRSISHYQYRLSNSGVSSSIPTLSVSTKVDFPIRRHKKGTPTAHSRTCFQGSKGLRRKLRESVSRRLDSDASDKRNLHQDTSLLML